MPFSRECLDLFLRLEQTSRPDSAPESDHYETIGQFYGAIKQGLRDVCAALGEAAVFCGEAVPPDARRGTSTGARADSIIVVDGLTSALAALDEVVEQGEGAGHTEVSDEDADPLHPDRRQAAHYYRLEELRLGRRYRPGDTPRSGPTGEVQTRSTGPASRPCEQNPRLADHPSGSPIRDGPGGIRPLLSRTAVRARASVRR